MIIRAVENEAEFCALKHDWDKLAEHSTMKFDWIYRWWKYFGKGHSLKILVAEENDNMIGIAPLYLHNSKVFKLFPFRKLCFLGGDISDYPDFLARNNDDRKRIFGVFLHYMLNNITYDALELSGLNSSNSGMNIWKKYVFLNDFEIVRTRANTGLDLTKFGSYQDYRNNFLSKKLKTSIKLGLKKLDRNDVKVEYVFKNNIGKSDIAVISELSRNKPGITDLFGKTVSGRFLKEYFLEVGSEFKLLAYVKFNDVIVAYALSMVNDKTLYCWNMAFSNAYVYFCPSKLLLNELIRYAFDNNFEHLDFMREEESRRFRWGNNRSINYNIVKDVSLKARLVSLCRKTTPESILKMLLPYEVKIS